MKKIYIYAIAALFVTGNYGCKKFLEQVPNDRLTFDESFATRSTVEQLLANVYSTLPDEMQQRFPANGNTAGAWTGASDEANYTLPSSFSNNINSGNWDATTGQVNTMWQLYYRGIQASSNFMANVGKCTDCNNNGVDLVSRYRAEAKGIRAIYYYYLLRQYGPLVLLGNDPIAADAPISAISKPRSTFDECVDYIVAELDGAAEGLPALPQGDSDYGHVNKAVLHAYKIQVLLTAASPLFNGNTAYADFKNADGTQLVSQTVSTAKWTRAAAAAKSFITTYPNYSLFKKTGTAPAGVDQTLYNAFLAVRDVMLTDWNSEVIFAKPNADITNLGYNMSPNHNNGSGGDKGGSFLSASQQLVEAYFMANGKPTTDNTSGFTRTGFTDYKAPDDNIIRSVQNMYVGREARFYAGITYTNRKWINPNTTLVTSFEFNGNAGKSSIGNDDYSSTGYTQRKNLGLSGWSTGGRTNIFIRLSEIYLDYVEAAYEANPSDPDVLVYLNLIRERAGIPQYGTGANALPVPADLRAAIRLERQVELAFESHRYFDTRRWKIAATTDKFINGLDITKNAATGFYNIVQQESRVFDAKHYLWPIPNGEIQKVPLLVQNPGW
ncbi:RagB/SusD family nutrient uptake outer membrane protein [Pedobacter metabolipauper]|uniref:Putative outer membrane starch-binding protein n=1 Tax=Pedobacter metabolipauper TaxID=425513 RepID=A0A4R6SZS1_9SPHI|nr:RagB/SusD family nutrient uptake outer membrane protein [Pedobacter metabolipauper]TDQ10045.1 putative outer membrane starch-binding protein [Pedobacter metabolipauper]